MESLLEFRNRGEHMGSKYMNIQELYDIVRRQYH